MPGDPDDGHSCFIEAAIDGMIVGWLYLPNGNPAPGPKLDHKLRWFERLHSHAAKLFELDVPVALAGHFSVMPTDLDVCKPERWRDDALFRQKYGQPMPSLLPWAGRTLLHPEERIYLFWKHFRNAFTRDAGLRIGHFLLSPSLREDCRPAASTSLRGRGSTPAITRRSGSNSMTTKPLSPNRSITEEPTDNGRGPRF